MLQSTESISGFEATDLRSLPVKELVSLLWTALHEKQDQVRTWARGQVRLEGSERHGALQQIAEAKEYAARRPKRTTRLSDEHFRQVAVIYDNAVKAPTKAVADAFVVSHSTATKWVARAEELGYLSQTTPGARRRLSNPPSNRKRKA